MIETVIIDKNPVKLSELTQEIAEVVNGHFGDRFYWVIAEITSYRFVAKTGYHYFELTEKQTSVADKVTRIGCTAFSVGSECIRNFESYTRQRFGNNIEVMVKIKVDYSLQYGLRTILHDVDVAFTIGNLEKLKQQTLQKLLREESDHVRQVGEQYITTNKKLVLPKIIKGIALITSRESEGYTDFCHTLEANPWGYRYHLFRFFCKVQADTAVEEMIDCLKTIWTRYREYIDAVVICRGGGAQTDFLTFNQYSLCRAVARFPIPVITGIGHHSNQTLTDLLAHTQTKTPTQAAEFIISYCHQAELEMLDLQKSITISTQRLLAQKEKALSESRSGIINATHRLLAARKEAAAQYHHQVVTSTYRLIGSHKHQLAVTGGLLASKPGAIIAVRRSKLDHESARLRIFSEKMLTFQKGYISHFSTLFKHLDVEKTLAKGFAIIRKNGEVIADPDRLAVGDTIDIRLQRKTLTSKITAKKDGTGPDL